MSVISTQPPEGAIATWFHEIVLGLPLCPFAQPVHKREQIRWVTSAAQDFESAVREAMAESSRLIITDAEKVATTMVLYPSALADFEEYLDAAAVLEAALEEAGAAELLQVATFHPDYQFEGDPPEAIDNLPGRAPVPILHLLRVDAVADAVARHPDPHDIAEQNVALLKSLSAEARRALWSWLPDDDLSS